MKLKIVTLLFCYTLSPSLSVAADSVANLNSEIQSELATAKSQFLGYFAQQKANDNLKGKIKEFLKREKTITQEQALVNFMKSIDSLVKKSSDNQFDIVSLSQFILALPRYPFRAYTEYDLIKTETLKNGNISPLHGIANISDEQLRQNFVRSMEMMVLWVDLNKENITAYQKYLASIGQKKAYHLMVMDESETQAVEKLKNAGIKISFPIFEMIDLDLPNEIKVQKYFPEAAIKDLVKQAHGAVVANELPKQISNLDTQQAYLMLKEWIGYKFEELVTYKTRGKEFYRLSELTTLISANEDSLRKVINEKWIKLPLEKSTIYTMISLNAQYSKQLFDIAFATPTAIYVTSNHNYTKFESVYLKYKKAFLNEEINNRFNDLEQRMNEKISDLQNQIDSLNSYSTGNDLAQTNHYLRLINTAMWTSVVLQTMR